MSSPFLKSPSGAIARARQADPNKQRCLIENRCYDSSEEYVQAKHVFERKFSLSSQKMNALEWNWDMKQNTLDLDSRRNVFFLGASLYGMLDKNQWCMVPEDSIVCLFVDKNNKPRNRFNGFPVLNQIVFKYRLIPFAAMEDVYITRQSFLPAGKSTIDVHFYPFENFPVIESHVDPKFVILRTGIALSTLQLTERRSLYTAHPILSQVYMLYTMWLRLPGHTVGLDPRAPALNLQNGWNTPSASDSGEVDDLLETPQRRIPINAPNDTVSAPAEESEEEEEVAPKPVKRVQPTRAAKAKVEKGKSVQITEKPVPLTIRAINKHKREHPDSEGAQWTPRKTTKWAEDCVAGSPSRHSGSASDASFSLRRR